MHTHDPLGHETHSGDYVEEGWYAIRQRASHALTHFAPPEIEQEQWHHVAHWALLPAELWETQETVEIGLEAPGMAPDRFDVEVIEGILLVRGTKILEERPQSARYFLRERAYGYFERSFHLPAAVIDAEACARYRDGVLRISLPKAQRRQESRIVVENAE